MTAHITMPAITPIIRYLASGDQKDFAYPFPIFSASDLAVFIDGAHQVSGFTITGAGHSEGGTVHFTTAPPAGSLVTLERCILLARTSDFLEGGHFSARAINTELDYLVAGLQQIERSQSAMLRYTDHETPAHAILPDKAIRAGKALGFDEAGNPVAVSLEGSMSPPDFTAIGTGAITRTSHDKFSDLVSVKDFGAVGDGLSDDTLAIQKALQAYQAVFVPTGIYLISQTLSLSAAQSLTGAGASSVLRCLSNDFNALEIPTHSTALNQLRIEGGKIGVKLFGGISECTRNSLSDLQISGAETGLLLDGHESGERPCYWNRFTRIVIEHPLLHGVHLTLSGAGDTPNANTFTMVRVYSKGTPTSGAGFYVEHGSFNNAFVDCEANVNGASAQGCFIMGSGSHKTLLVNPYAESFNLVPNVKLEAGSLDTSIFNLLSASDGSALYDLSGGSYTAINSGFPYKNRLQRSSITDLTTTLQRFDTEYIDQSGTVDLDISHSVHLVSSFGGALSLVLPPASESVGAEMTIKKIDSSANLVTITESGGVAPDGRAVVLGGENDYVTVISNGAKWFITGSNRMAGNTRYFDGSGIYDLDLAVDVYFLSSFGGAMTARLPPANAAESIGRVVTIKKTDSSANIITLTEQGGNGPDGYGQPLSNQYEAITVVSNGGQWFILSRFP